MERACREGSSPVTTSQGYGGVRLPGGALLVAELDGSLAGFVAGWVEQAHNIAGTPDLNRFGLNSDIWVMPNFRGHRLATRLRVTGLAANAPARSSYQRAGFRPYQIVYENLIGGGDDD